MPNRFSFRRIVSHDLGKIIAILNPTHRRISGYDAFDSSQTRIEFFSLWFSCPTMQPRGTLRSPRPIRITRTHPPTAVKQLECDRKPPNIAIRQSVQSRLRQRLKQGSGPMETLYRVGRTKQSSTSAVKRSERCLALPTNECSL